MNSEKIICHCCKNSPEEGNLILPSSGIIRGKERSKFTGMIIIKETPICDRCNRDFEFFY